MFFSLFKKSFRFTGVFFASAIFWPLATHAVVVSPLKQTVTIDPGTEQIIRVHVENSESQPVVLEPSVDAFTVDPKTGAARFGAPDDAIEWVTATPASMTLAPRSDGDVFFTVRIPRQAEPGTHSIGLFVQTKPGEGQISLSSRVGSLLYLVVSGTVREMLSIDFAGPQHAFVWRSPAMVDLQLKNLGTVHVVPEGDLVLLDMFDREIARRPVNAQRSTMIPGGVFSRTIPFDHVPWTALGRVTGAGTIRYGATGRTAWMSFSFWYVPWQVPACLLGVIGVIAVGVLRAKKTYA